MAVQQSASAAAPVTAPESAPVSAPPAAPTYASAPAPTYAPALASMSEEGRYSFRAAAVVGFVVGIVDILIAARFLGKLLGASSQAAFVSFVYAVSGPLVAPFKGIFGNAGSGANSFETADLIAIVVYAVIGWGLVMLIRIISAPRGTRPATS